MAELADAADLGSASQEWGFKSLYPHQFECKVPHYGVTCILFYTLNIKGREQFGETTLTPFENI